MNTSVGHALKMARGILAVLLVVNVTLVAQAGNKVTSIWDEIKVPFDDSDMIDALVERALVEQDIVASPEKTVFKIADSSVLSDFFPTELDIFIFILVGNGDWYMEIKDC